MYDWIKLFCAECVIEEVCSQANFVNTVSDLAIFGIRQELMLFVALAFLFLNHVKEIFIELLLLQLIKFVWKTTNVEIRLYLIVHSPCQLHCLLCCLLPGLGCLVPTILDITS